jgi:hypothetical protein
MAMLPRNKPTGGIGVPVIQYFKGSKLIEWKQEGEEDWRTGLAGFLAEADRYGEEFDAACGAAELQQVIVLHSFNQAPTEKRYWWFGKHVALYPLTTGPTATTIGGLLRKQEETINAGIGVRWPQEEVITRNGREERKRGSSSIYLRAYAQMLIEVGYAKPVQVGVKGPLSVSFLDALLTHVSICEVADAMARERSGDDAEVSLIEMAWPLARAEKPINVGKEQTSRVYEFRTLHPAEPDRNYLASIYLPKEHRQALTEAIERDFPHAVEWAREFAATGVGEPGPAPTAQAETNGAEPVATTKNAPQAVSDDDINEDEIPF